MKVCFRWFSFAHGWFSGSMLHSLITNISPQNDSKWMVAFPFGARPIFGCELLVSGRAQDLGETPTRPATQNRKSRAVALITSAVGPKTVLIYVGLSVLWWHTMLYHDRCFFPQDKGKAPPQTHSKPKKKLVHTKTTQKLTENHDKTIIKQLKTFQYNLLYTIKTWQNHDKNQKNTFIKPTPSASERNGDTCGVLPRWCCPEPILINGVMTPEVAL